MVNKKQQCKEIKKSLQLNPGGDGNESDGGDGNNDGNQGGEG